MENDKFTAAMARIESITRDKDGKADIVQQSPAIQHVPLTAIMSWNAKQRALIECDAPHGNPTSVRAYMFIAIPFNILGICCDSDWVLRNAMQYYEMHRCMS